VLDETTCHAGLMAGGRRRGGLCKS